MRPGGPGIGHGGGPHASSSVRCLYSANVGKVDLNILFYSFKYLLSADFILFFVSSQILNQKTRALH